MNPTSSLVPPFTESNADEVLIRPADCAVSDPPSPDPLGPVRDAERIPTLDIMRGAALLGILLMNILAFGLPFSASFNPSVAGGDTGLNLWSWIIQYAVFDGKMRGIFSVMFGAGVYLMLSRGEGKGTAVADIHFRRMLW